MLAATFLIPALPLAGFALLVLAGPRLRDPLAGWGATAASAASFAVACVVFAGLVGRHAEQRRYVQNLFTWIAAGGFHVDVAFQVDPLSITMALFVTGIGTLIHLYSVGYMHGDPRFPRFFVYLNLFLFSMLVLVLADNYLLTFLGWEGVGACSYLLISFWFERESAAVAGKKAFVTNRVGDFGFMIAMFLLFSKLGTLTYRTAFAGAGSLSRTTATAIALLLFVGAAGKSAQLPLYVWLPDAMEGPTPVSALIHAATMVTAGVFLLVRSAPILSLAPAALTVVAVVGGLTALFAATVACAQDDIKKVLAYSTVSQLGYMVLAVGSGFYVAAIFHMITHAFFKALLFLGAGSVIHGLHEEQDMKRMGNLRRWMPITWATFLVGWLAISGIPPFAGFWSKDDILLGAYTKSPLLWAVGAVTALLTAYYMSRQVFLVFYGQERWRSTAHADKAELTEPEPVAPEGSHEAHPEPHESPWTMWLPLAVLAALAAVGGLLNLPVAHSVAFLERWLEPVVGPHEVTATAGTGLKITLAVVSAALAFAGVLVAARLWLGRSPAENERLEPEVLRRAWFVDRSYAWFFGGPGREAAEVAVQVDRRGVDGAVNGLATLVRGSGTGLRRLQTGYVRNYALGVAAGAVLLLAYVVVRAGV